jgi:signal peptidase I
MRNMSTEMTGGRLLRIGGLLFLVLALWVLVGPSHFGGSVSYVITQGDSMEPLFHSGDLVIVRESADYAVGDIIAADNKQLRAPVLHRIIEEREGSYVTKGDNNDFIDEYRPRHEDLMGKKWILIPGGGTFLRAVLTPFWTSFLVGLLALFVAWDMRRRQETPEPVTVATFEPARTKSETPTQQLRWFALPIALALAYFLALGFFAFTRPVTEIVARDATLTHSGRFTYGGQAKKGPLYPKGILEAGGVIHTSHIETVRFSFTDEITSDEPLALAGTARLTAILSSDIGWSRRFELAQEDWTGAPVLSGKLHVRRLATLARRVTEDTGVSTPFTLRVQAVVGPEGRVAGQEFSEPFTADLPFQLASGILQPVFDTEDPSQGLLPTMDRVVTVRESNKKNVEMLGIRIPVENARQTAMTGGLIAALLAAGLALAYKRALDSETEAERIVTRYSEWLVPVTTLESLEGLPSVPMSDIEGLVKMADRQGRMALYVVDDPDVFFFEQGGIVYFYETATRRQPVVNAPLQLPRSSRRSVRVSIDTLEEAEKAARSYRDGRTVVMDLAAATPAAARRIVDFAGGLVYATGGRLTREKGRQVVLHPPGADENAPEANPNPATGRGAG